MPSHEENQGCGNNHIKNGIERRKNSFEEIRERHDLKEIRSGGNTASDPDPSRGDSTHKLIIARKLTRVGVGIQTRHDRIEGTKKANRERQNKKPDVF